MRAPDLETGRAGHSVTQGANLAARDGDFSHVEELDLGNGRSIELVEELAGVGPLNLIPVKPAHDRNVPGDGPLVSLQLDFVFAGFGVILNPVVNRGPADEQQLIFAKVKEDGVANHMSVVAASDELLRLVDRIILEAVDAGRRHQLDRVRAFDPHVGHVVRLIEQHARLLPRALLIPPIGKLGRNHRIHVRTQLRISQHLHRIAGGVDRVLQIFGAHC